MTDPNSTPHSTSNAPRNRTPGEDPGDPARSGLRDPARSARSVGSAALAVEVVTLLLAIVPMITLGGGHTGAVLVLIGTLIVANVVLLGMLRHGWAWYAALLPPLALIGATWLRVALGILGSLYLLLWVFVLYVRRTVLSPPRRD